MSVYIYRRERSNGATELAEAGGWNRYRAINTPMERKVRAGDTVVCWGESLVPIEGVRILNGVNIRDKYTDAVLLKEKGVPTIEVSRTKPETLPPTPAGPDPAFGAWQEASDIAESFVNMDANNPVSRGPVMIAAVEDLWARVDRLRAALRTPAPVPTPAVQAGLWLARRSNHVGGNDLFSPPTNPDFYVRKENIVREFRVHSFLGKSIRAGVKKEAEVGTDGAPVQIHPWIRSMDGGWRISYDGVTSRQVHRDLAHSACEALGLDFAAVDIGELDNGRLIVLECNRAPGVEGGTVTNYAEAIRQWIGV